MSEKEEKKPTEDITDFPEIPAVDEEEKPPVLEAGEEEIVVPDSPDPPVLETEEEELPDLSDLSDLRVLDRKGDSDVKIEGFPYVRKLIEIMFSGDEFSKILKINKIEHKGRRMSREETAKMSRVQGGGGGPFSNDDNLDKGIAFHFKTDKDRDEADKILYAMWAGFFNVEDDEKMLKKNSKEAAEEESNDTPTVTVPNPNKSSLSSVEIKESISEGDVTVEKEEKQEKKPEVIGNSFEEVRFLTAFGFLKFLSILGAKPVWKKSADDNFFCWEIFPGICYMLTGENPLESKGLAGTTFVIVFSPEYQSNLVRVTKVLSGKAVFTNRHTVEEGNLSKALEYNRYSPADINVESVTKIPFQYLTQAIEKGASINSMPAMLTLFAIKKIEEENGWGAYKHLNYIKRLIANKAVFKVVGIAQGIQWDQAIVSQLVKSGFLSQNYTPTNVANAFIRLNKYCFQEGMHPFSAVWYSAEDIYDKGNSISYIEYEGERFYTDNKKLFETGGKHIPKIYITHADECSEVMQERLVKEVEKHKKVRYEVYGYCFGLMYRSRKKGDKKEVFFGFPQHDPQMRLGFFILHNEYNKNELYVPSAVLMYLEKSYGYDLYFEADYDASPNVLFVREGDKEGKLIAMILTEEPAATGGVGGRFFMARHLVKDCDAVGSNFISFSAFSKRDGDKFVNMTDHPELPEERETETFEETLPGNEAPEFTDANKRGGVISVTKTDGENSEESNEQEFKPDPEEGDPDPDEEATEPETETHGEEDGEDTDGDSEEEETPTGEDTDTSVENEEEADPDPEEEETEDDLGEESESEEKAPVDESLSIDDIAQRVIALDKEDKDVILIDEIYNEGIRELAAEDIVNFAMKGFTFSNWDKKSPLFIGVGGKYTLTREDINSNYEIQKIEQG